MRKDKLNITKLLMISLGGISITLSVFLLFTPITSAYGQAGTDCPGSDPITCTGYHCTSVDHKSCDWTSSGNLENANSFHRKIQGVRVTPAANPGADSTQTTASYSASQQSYVQLVEHLDGLIETYAADALYNPNEEDLKLTSLRNYSAELKAKNTAVIDTYTV